MAGVLCVNPVFAAGNVDDEILPLPKALQDVLVDASAIANINSQDNKQNNKAYFCRQNVHETLIFGAK